MAKKTNILVRKSSPQTRKVWREVKRDQSYTQTVKATTNTSEQTWKGISFDTEEADIKWLVGSYIGRVSNYSKVDEIMEEVIKNGMGRINIKYMGENAAFIQGIEGTELGNLIDDNKEYCRSKNMGSEKYENKWENI